MTRRAPTLKPRISALRPAIRAVQYEEGAWRQVGATSADRGYGAKWREARIAYLRENPLCRYCNEEGRIRAASVVDHIEPHRGDMTLFWRRSNWQPLCASCHSGRKQREERAGRGGSKVGGVFND